MPCRAVPCRAVPCRAVPCRAVPCRAVPCRAVPYWSFGNLTLLCSNKRTLMVECDLSMFLLLTVIKCSTSLNTKIHFLLLPPIEYSGNMLSLGTWAGRLLFPPTSCDIGQFSVVLSHPLFAPTMNKANVFYAKQKLRRIFIISNTRIYYYFVNTACVFNIHSSHDFHPNMLVVLVNSNT